MNSTSITRNTAARPVPPVAAHVGPRRTRAWSLVAIALVAVALSVPAVAFAATTAPAPALSTLFWTTTTTTDKRGAVFVYAELPASTKLPAKVVIPVPPGVQPEWVGEIVGSDPSKDPTATYTIEQADGYGIMTVTVKTARIAQAEFVVGAPASGADVVLSANVRILGPVGDVTVSIEPPAGSSVTTATPGLVKTTAGGKDVYEISKRAPAVGTLLSGSITAKTGSSSSTAAGQASPATATASGSAPAGGGNAAATMVATLLTALVGFGLYGAWANRGKLAELVKGSTAEPEADRKDDPPVAAPKRRSGRSPAVPAEKPEPVAEPGAEPGPEEEEDAEPEPVAEPVAESERTEIAVAEAGPPAPAGGTASPVPPGHDLVVMVKELAALRTRGLLESDEFAEAKRSLLAGDARVVILISEVAGFHASGLLTPDEFTCVKEHLLTGSSEIVAEIEDLVALNVEDLLTREEFRTVVDRLLVA